MGTVYGMTDFILGLFIHQTVVMNVSLLESAPPHLCRQRGT